MRYRQYTWIGILLIGTSCAWAQISEQRLFTISYGTGKDQLAVPPLREEIESVPTQAPLIMRRLQTGDFAIISYRHGDGVVVQVFSAVGRLHSYALLPAVDPADPLAVYEGNIYSFLYATPTDLDREELIRAFRTDGKAVPLDETRKQLAAVLKEINFDGYGKPLACGEALYIPVYYRTRGETHLKLITLTKSGDIEVDESDLPLFGYPVCLPGCEIGVLEFSSPDEDAEIILRRKSGAEIARATVDTGLVADLTPEGSVLHIARVYSFVAKDNHLVVPFLVSHENEDTTLGFPKHINILVILDSKGKVIKRVPFDTPVGTLRVWDTDSEGNVYYLAFTKEGAEMRKLVIR